ncbi:MAG TPA: hypothetical protein VH877_24225 [Polyangia bacterium]|nr:hypothetical protein [Polyangia bacterium]
MSPFALILIGAAVPASAQPPCELRGKAWLEGRVLGSAQPPRNPVDARLGEEIEVFVAASGHLGGKPVTFSESDARGRVSWLRSGCGPLQVTWRRVEPRMEHVTTPAPNAQAQVYANAVVFGPSHGKWLGFDRIEYVETPIEGAAPILRVRDARPSPVTGIERSPALSPLGVMRLAATLCAAGQCLSTPDAKDAPEGLISERVFRYTFRDGDGFVGWLTSFFNVPYLFGSAGAGARSQAERYLGADCADILVAALRRAGRSDLAYTSVAELVGRLERVAGPAEVRPCAPSQGPCAALAQPPLRFGRDVRPGDLIALDYLDDSGQLPRAWDHIVALIEDRGPDGTPDGLLGADDLVADSGDAQGLKFAPLGEQGAVRMEILRAHGVPLR